MQDRRRSRQVEGPEYEPKDVRWREGYRILLLWLLTGLQIS